MARQPITLGTNGHAHVGHELVVDAASSRVARPTAGSRPAPPYDPDAAYDAASFRVPAEEYVKRFHVRHTITTEAGVTSHPALDAIMLEPVRASERWRPVRITSTRDFRAFFESERGKHKRFLESGDDFETGEMTGRSSTHLIDREYVPAMAGPFNKQMYLSDYLQMHSRSFELKNHNALAASANKIMTRFVLGRGLSFHVKNPVAQKVWQEFWDRENMRRKLRYMTSDLMWQGELLLRFYEPRAGYVSLRNLDASTCWEVVTDPEDIERVFYYHFQWPSPYQVWVSGQIPVSKYFIQQIPPTNICHVKINESSQEKRGRSDLLPAMPWLKRFNDFYNGQTVKAMLEANLVWKIKVRGDQADVDKFLTDPTMTELPPPGGVWVENESVELSPSAATLTANRGSGGIGQQIAAIVATSLNLPAEYLNIEMGGAPRATALVRTDPAVKAIEDRQQIMRETLEEIYDRVMAAALQAGRIRPSAIQGDPDTEPDDGAPRRPILREPVRVQREPVV